MLRNICIFEDYVRIYREFGGNFGIPCIHTHHPVEMVLSTPAKPQANPLEHILVDNCSNLIKNFQIYSSAHNVITFFSFRLYTNQFDNCSAHPISIEVPLVRHMYVVGLAASPPTHCTLNLMIFARVAPIIYPLAANNSMNHSKNNIQNVNNVTKKKTYWNSAHLGFP